MKAVGSNAKRGSAVIGALIISLLAGLISAAVLSSALTEMKMSRRHQELQHAVTLAEAGLEEGVRALKNGDWTGWTSYGTYGRYIELDGRHGIFAGWGRTGEVKIYVHSNMSDPSIAAEATVTNRAAGSSLKRQIRVDMSSGSLFDNGVVSRDSTTFNGGNVLVDSYDSRVGGYSFSTRAANATVATLSVQNDDLDIGNGHVRGYLATAGGTVDIGQGTVHDYDGSYPRRYRDPSRITTDFYADLPSIDAPNTTGFVNLGDITSGTTIGSVGATGYIVDSISLSGGTLTLVGDVTLVVRGDVRLTGNGEIAIASSSSMEMYADGNVDIRGNGMANTTNAAENAIIYGMNTVDGDKSVTLGGNAALYAAVYAPHYNFVINGGGVDGEMHGAVVGYEITMNGGANFHYDEALADMSGGDNFTIDSWRELKSVGEKLPFDNPSSLASHF